MEMTYIWLILASMLGGMLQVVLGFGYAVLAMVFFPLFLSDVPASATVCCLASFVCSISIFLQFWRAARPRAMLWPLIAFFIIMPLSNLLAIRLPQQGMELALGVFLIALGLYYLLGAQNLRLRVTPATGLVAGSVSGLFSGLFAVSAPPIALYCLSVLDDKDAYMGTTQFFFVVTNLYAATVRTVNGLVTRQVLLWTLLSALGICAGVLLGRLIYRRVQLNAMKNWVYIFVTAMGVWTVISYFL